MDLGRLTLADGRVEQFLLAAGLGPGCAHPGGDRRRAQAPHRAVRHRCRSDRGGATAAPVRRAHRGRWGAAARRSRLADRAAKCASLGWRFLDRAGSGRGRRAARCRRVARSWPVPPACRSRGAAHAAPSASVGCGGGSGDARSGSRPMVRLPWSSMARRSTPRLRGHSTSRSSRAPSVSWRRRSRDARDRPPPDARPWSTARLERRGLTSGVAGCTVWRDQSTHWGFQRATRRRTTPHHRA